MTPELSRKLGKAAPTMTFDERERIIKAGNRVEHFNQLSKDVQNLVNVHLSKAKNVVDTKAR